MHREASCISQAIVLKIGAALHYGLIVINVLKVIGFSGSSKR